MASNNICTARWRLVVIFNSAERLSLRGLYHEALSAMALVLAPRQRIPERSFITAVDEW
jgi:hypothetical protein